jgi:hypothetical protein
VKTEKMTWSARGRGQDSGTQQSHVRTKFKPIQARFSLLNEQEIQQLRFQLALLSNNEIVILPLANICNAAQHNRPRYGIYLNTEDINETICLYLLKHLA